MSYVKILILLAFVLNIFPSIKAVDEPSSIDLIAENGYPYEKHFIVTEDAYILSLIRIPYGKTNSSKKNVPVLLHPGLLGSAAQFLITSPNRSLSYILADNGYDVWLINPRGTVKDSQKNLYIDEKTNKRAFYNYSWHEIGIFDNPAAIDYILNQTNKKQIHYIGHSQGCTTFFVMASERPEYNNKILLASLLSPSAFLVTASPLYQILFPYSDILRFLAKLLHIYDIPANIIRNVLRSICAHSIFYFICTLVYDFSLGYPDPNQIDPKIFHQLYTFTPADGTVMELLHYLQIMKARGRFQQYDYGQKGNLRQYNSSIPPAYNVSKITAPCALYVGDNDMYVSIKNAETLKSKLNQEPYYYLVPHRGWNHGDFLIANDVVKLLYNEVLRIMSKYEN